MNLETILITGGCGFLGQYLTNNLLSNFPDAKIKILDLKPNPAPIFEFSNNPKVETILNKDICDYNSIKSHFENTDLIIHLAGLVSFSLKDKNLLKKINILGTKNILKAAIANNTTSLIHISSTAALGYNDDKNTPITESFNFDWHIAEKRKKYYMLTKHLADRHLQSATSNNPNTLILHPALMLGPGDLTNSAKLINAVKKNKIPFNMPGGTNIIDVRDVSDAIIAAIKKNITKDSLIISGHNLTFKQINKTIASLLNASPPKLTLPKFLNPPLFYILLTAEAIAKQKLTLTADNLDSAFKFRYFNNNKAKAVLHWQPKFSFEQTINDTIKWMDQNDLFKR